ncbi:MAG: DUF5678 domain-containing protein [Thermodesulfobacteriota bacterium]
MIQLSEEIRALEAKWVAIDEDGNVVEYSEDLENLKDKISKLPFRVYIYKVPKLDINFLPTTI